MILQMKAYKYIFLIFTLYCFCYCNSIKGQQENVKYDNLTQQNVYVFVEKMPKYKKNIGIVH